MLAVCTEYLICGRPLLVGYGHRVPQRVVLEVSKLAEADLRIRTRYNIPKPRSDHFEPAKWLEELQA